MRLFSCFIFLVLLSGCKESGTQDGQAAATPPEVQVLEVKKDSITGYQNYPASIEGIVSSEVRAKVSGYIQNVMVDAGQRVTKGQPLFRLETETLNEDAQAAQASVNAAQVEVEKLVPLVDQGIISSVQLETARANLARAKSNYNSIAAKIGYATVKSPVDGYLGSINFREGSLVSPSDPKPLTSVSNIERVYAFFSMNEAQYLDFLQEFQGNSLEEKVKNFPRVSLKLVNGSLYDQQGEIETVSGQINPESGTVSFRAVFDNPGELLSDGNSGTIMIPSVYPDHILVPERSVFDMQGEVFAYRVTENNTLEAVKLNYIDIVNNQYVVTGGLAPGDRIVAIGPDRLRASQQITPRSVPYDSVARPIEAIFK
ncbi:efflux RND transporter periplasmic adaptor subunit [Robertkochia flava]|uniref:efflux RND transporter periplasmic adaptor subunit n=1 Tax=Robertkochia flava TaxID=3447986 RepID=UPI001CC9E50F|nr:efflux RND transporter periplasmic adaptor subunit [Robertkochia marina]